MADISFNLDVGLSDKKSVDDILRIKSSTNGTVNNYNDGSTIILNSDRLILNTKKDYLMLCGQEGLLLTSPKSVHIDCDDDIYIFSNTELYLGLPNRGEPYDFNKQKEAKTKADPTKNIRYEPLVLGLKLANWLEDLTTLLQQTIVNGAAGSSQMSPEMIENLKALESRIPEIVSTYAYIDGVSHKAPNAYTPTIQVSNQQGTSNAGSTVGASSMVSNTQTNIAGAATVVTPANNPLTTTTVAGGEGLGGATPNLQQGTSLTLGEGTSASTNFLNNITLTPTSTNVDGDITSPPENTPLTPLPDVVNPTAATPVIGSNSMNQGSGWTSTPPQPQTYTGPSTLGENNFPAGTDKTPFTKIKQLLNKGHIGMKMPQKEVYYIVNYINDTIEVVFYSNKRFVVSQEGAVKFKGSYTITGTLDVNSSALTDVELRRDDGKYFSNRGETLDTAILKMLYTA